MRDFDYQLPNADYVSPNDIQPGAILTGTNLSDATLVRADLSKASIQGANLSNANIQGSDLSDAYILAANLSNADLWHTNLSDANLRDTDFSDANLTEANLSGADLVKTDLSDADLRGANLSDADLSEADLSGANLSGADLSGACVEHAVFHRTNFFDSNLTNSLPHGATFTDVQINDDTVFRSEVHRKEDARWWQKGPFLPPQRCGYDPATSNENGESDTDQLGKAADTYQTFEKLARENARPTLESEMFVLRQDMQRKRHWHNDEYFNWAFARISRTIFKYGESLGRIVLSTLLIIVAYGAIYAQFDLILNSDGQFVDNLVDSIYFSTLTFTTLGLGDFQPSSSSEFARALVTTQAALGAILIAIFVFVLGRRAAK